MIDAGIELLGSDSSNLNAFIAAATSELAPATEIQVGTGVETRIGDVVTMVGQILGKALRIQSEDQRVRPDTSEVERLLCDYSEATRLTGWTPQVEFKAGLGRVIEYLARNQGAGIPSNAHDYVI